MANQWVRVWKKIKCLDMMSIIGAEDIMQSLDMTSIIGTEDKSLSLDMMAVIGAEG